MNNFIKDFKEFAVKGNMIDLAIGIVVGGAFSKIVQSLVKDIIMPAFGYAAGGIDFKDKAYVLRPAVVDAAGTVTREAVAITYGNFIQVCLDFFIIALCIFVVIRGINSMKRKAEEPGNTEVPTPKDIQLLTDIRDLLQQNGGKPPVTGS